MLLHGVARAQDTIREYAHEEKSPVCMNDPTEQTTAGRPERNRPANYTSH